MPTIEQIRAARALLDWSQSDLAEYAGLSQTGIARIENGTNQPNSRTVQKIETAFSQADIEFLSSTGLRKRTNEIRILRGTNGFRDFMDDVYQQTKATGKNICLFNGMPNQFIKFLGQEWYENHSNRMKEIDNEFACRIIVKEGETLFIAGGFAEYRWFPKEQFNERTIYTYGNKIAFMQFKDDDVEIQVLPNATLLADSFRTLFNLAWDNMAVKPNIKK